MKQLRESTVWQGTYKGINFKIAKSAGIDKVWKASWVYYIYLHLNQFTDKEFAEKLWLEQKFDEKGRLWFNYMSSAAAQVELHGGITYYRRHEPKVVELGCDFQHYCDEGRQYDLEDVYREVRNSIDSVHGLSEYQVMAMCCGVMTKLSDTFEVEEGRLYSSVCGCEWSERAKVKINNDTKTSSH